MELEVTVIIGSLVARTRLRKMGIVQMATIIPAMKANHSRRFFMMCYNNLTTRPWAGAG